MVSFWMSAAVIAAKMERLRNIEGKLLALSTFYRSSSEPTSGPAAVVPHISVVDTKIPRSAVPLEGNVVTTKSLFHRRGSGSSKTKTGDDNDSYVIHSIHVSTPRTCSDNTTSPAATTAVSTSTPLVLLHGYMNGGAYFYRTFHYLSRYFDSIHSLDLLGWGLSSRPAFHRIQSYDAAELFFVESLEAWRQSQQIPKMILAGHSMGGYLSVAYCERYPQHVERLILLSPVGVPAGNDVEHENRKQIRQQTWSLRARLLYNVYETLFDYRTLGDVLRLLPAARGKQLVAGYSNRRLNQTRAEELNVLTDYLYESNTLPGSGEYCLSRILHSNINAKHPLQHRIPHLSNVASVSFLYGSDDWMDCTGGLRVQDSVRQQKEKPFDVDVFRVQNAGHLLILEQPEQVAAGMILAATPAPERANVIQALQLQTTVPALITLQQYQREQQEIAASEMNKTEEPSSERKFASA